jgi:hypothetical protein
MLAATLTLLLALALWAVIVAALTRGLVARARWATAAATTIFWLIDPLTPLLCWMVAGLILGDFRR